jgi:uncharacterized protein YfaS (alpha-2-macroglobulin family)
MRRALFPTRLQFSTFVFSLALPLTVLLIMPLDHPAAQADEPDVPSLQAAKKLQDDGNFQEAFTAFEKIATSDRDSGDRDSSDIADALSLGVNCLQQLNRTHETDDFRQAVFEKHTTNWRVLQRLAQSYLQANHYGVIVAGEFRRGPHRGGGRAVNSIQRDRVRALQLYVAAIQLADDDEDRQSVGQLHLDLANALIQYYGQNNAWQLQALTNLEELPDYEEQSYGGHDITGAPVDENGDPVLYQVPDSWDAAASDGERWRWALAEASRIAPGLQDTAAFSLAQFLQTQFGVQTMQNFYWWPRPNDADDVKTSTFALHTLSDSETMARLANGIKRFELPDEFNFLRVYRELAEKKDSSYAPQARWQLASIYLNRRQYPQAAAEFNHGRKRHNKSYRWQEQIDQIEGNWCRFESTQMQPAGKGATVDLRFRNAQSVEFTAHRIDLDGLLAEIKKQLRKSPRDVDWNLLQINNLGYNIIQKDMKRFVKKEAARWNLALKPRPNHFDRRITVTTPLQDAGAYLLSARMPDGNTSQVVVWLADMAIVTRNLGEETLYVVTDAVTGQPIQRANVEFLGFRREHDANRIKTQNFAENTDADGFAMLPTTKDNPRYQWIAIARKGNRMAFLGFNSIWRGTYNRQTWSANRAFAVTDRPVYRPAQDVHFKIWVARPEYDQEETSTFAGQTMTVEILNPRNEKVYQEKIVADEYGGLEGTLTLPADATLGQYTLRLADWSVQTLHAPHDNTNPGFAQTGGSFRVEEYKKPEFEVSIDAPAEPIELGDSFTATVTAKYYFGSPVTGATVKYKVLRTRHDASWYPFSPWDWLYGSGYWWFTYDYDWYPGWRDWGCRRPAPWWFWRAPSPPEVIATAETKLGADGTLKIKIDTALAKEMHPDQDHSYQIQAEVVDQSRRTIVANGRVLVARQPFRVTTWVNRGYYRVGDTIRADFAARTIDGKPVAGDGSLKLLRITYEDNKPVETEVQRWDLATGEDGLATQQLVASQSGQYRLSYTVTDDQEHAIEGAYIFTVIGQGFDGRDFQFDHLEIIPDRREYKPGDKVALQINSNRTGGYVLLFVRPSQGVYQRPRVIRLDGKSTTVQLEVTKADMPNFFVEATTVASGKLHTVAREIFLPPEKRVLNVDVEPSAEEYRPGEPAKVRLRLTDHDGKPFVGSTIVAVYDKSVEYISGGSNVPEIRAFFWKWRRQHQPQYQTNLGRIFGNLPVKKHMANLGIFGSTVVDAINGFAGGIGGTARSRSAGRREGGQQFARTDLSSKSMAAPATLGMTANSVMEADARADGEMTNGAATMVEPEIRTEFADTALWIASLTTDAEGFANVEWEMPENLTTWRVRVWGMGRGIRVGEGDAEVVTRKNLIIRLQSPRFFVDTDEVVLSANVHNYLENAKDVRVQLELEGGTLELVDDRAEQIVTIDPEGEARVDWRVRVTGEGTATIRMLALTDEESDAMQMEFPVYVHGMLKQDPYSGSIRPQENKGSFTIMVPEDRRPEQTRLEVRYSPTLAAAMIDAIPYLVDYPYGCTEQSLNRFLPAAITRRVLARSGIDLEAIEKHRTNLNAQEIGDDKQRKSRWKRIDRNPVFDSEEHKKIVKAGVARLTEMQLSDGGWGWFSGFRQRSRPHTTAVVVHGLQVAESHDVALVPGVLQRGVQWLTAYQNRQIRHLDNARDGKRINEDLPVKYVADNLDALVFMVLTDADVTSDKMRDYLYRDRTKLAVYSLATYGLALHKLEESNKLSMIMRNIGQYLVEDDENQTAYLNLPGGYWWYWYGSEMEAHAYYLKLLVATDPKSNVAPRLVKYLLNNRRHATYWNSTRDTALVVEAFADYLAVTGETNPDMNVEVWVDGAKQQEVQINSENLFTFDNSFVLEGPALTAGKHTIELRKTGKGPLYYNGYLTNFTLEEFIKKAGLELRVQRKYYRLVEVDKSTKAAGSRGQVVDQRVEEYRREALQNLSQVTSGDLVEIELEIDSKNDYEYILLEDMKPAGFEPVEIRSGYTGNEMGAYVEFRDNRVVMFVARLARGKHSISYRMRAEIPGRFSALPTRASAMYAPELKGNSDEIKLVVVDEIGDEISDE